MILDNMAKESGRVLREDGSYLNKADWITSVTGINNQFLVSPSPSLSDQAGRMRGSLPIPLGDYKLINDRLPLFFDTETNGTATVEWNPVRKSHKMQTIADGDWAIVQTYQRHNYFAGKAQFVEQTQFAFHDEPNIEKRYGYFSSGITTPFESNLDGFYLYTDGTGHYLRIMNNGTEIANIAQADWDDPLDGTGISGFTVNWENFNVSQFNFLWLGGTGLRFSIVVGSNIYQVHNYSHVGGANADKLIFSSPNQPIRMEIRQTGVGSGLFEPVCSTVITEGSSDSGNIGSIRSVHTGASDLISASAGAEYVLKGLRLKEGYRDVVIDVVDVDPFVETINNFFLWKLHLNPTLSGVASWSDVVNSSVQEATGNGVLTITAAGTLLASGYGSSRSSSFVDVNTARKIGSAINGTRDEIWLTIEPIQGSTNLNSFGSILYKEFI